MNKWKILLKISIIFIFVGIYIIYTSTTKGIHMAMYITDTADLAIYAGDISWSLKIIGLMLSIPGLSCIIYKFLNHIRKEDSNEL